MTESESVALPLGDAPIANGIITEISLFVNTFLQNIFFRKFPLKITFFAYILCAFLSVILSSATYYSLLIGIYSTNQREHINLSIAV